MKAANTKDPDIDLIAPANNVISNSDTQQNQVVNTFVPSLDFEENIIPKEGNNLEIMITDVLKKEPIEGHSNSTSIKIHAREASPVLNDEPDGSIKGEPRQRFSGKEGPESTNKPIYMDFSDIDDSLSDGIDEPIDPTDDSKNDEDGISRAILDAVSSSGTDYAKIPFVDVKHDTTRLKNIRLSSTDPKNLNDSCKKYSNEVQNEGNYVPPDPKNESVKYLHQKRDDKTEVQLGESECIIRKRCQLYTDMALEAHDEVYEAHDALEDKNKNKYGDMLLEGKN